MNQSLSDLEAIVKNAKEEIYNRRKSIECIINSAIAQCIKNDNEHGDIHFKFEFDTNSLLGGFKTEIFDGWTKIAEVFETHLRMCRNDVKVPVFNMSKYQFPLLFPVDVVKQIYVKRLRKRIGDYKKRLEKMTQVEIQQIIDNISDQSEAFSDAIEKELENKKENGVTFAGTTSEEDSYIEQNRVDVDSFIGLCLMKLEILGQLKTKQIVVEDERDGSVNLMTCYNSPTQRCEKVKTSLNMDIALYILGKFLVEVKGLNVKPMGTNERMMYDFCVEIKNSF